MRTLIPMALLAASAGSALAGELAGVSMPDSTQVADQELVLNGMGLRKKAFIKVYVAGLYLPERQGDAAALLAADSPRRMVMQFKFGVSAKKMCGAWQEGLEANTPQASQGLEDQFDTLCSYMEDMESGDRMVYTYTPGSGTEVVVKEATKGTIEGKAFADALFACWIGPEPPGEDFKKGLLGG